jgi:copper chaperone CopZ
MIPSKITSEHVKKALAEIDAGSIPPGRKSTKFVLIFNGKRYPPKYVLSLANKFVVGEELDPSSFGGGQETNKFLTRLGFEIAESSSSRTNEGSISPPNKITKTTQKKHDERCPECKNTIERMLKKIYGVVKPNHKFYISTYPEKIEDARYHKNLRQIFVNLQNYKGCEKFVYTDTLPNCDYFVPNPGFVVEFDESQHFTAPRKISLQNYPRNLKVGFSLSKWGALCDKINAKDNDPLYRDEQRAWYDTLRDFLPGLNGNLEPTIRLYSEEMQWCRLDPDNPDDVARFKNIIESKRKELNCWIATVILQSSSDKDYSNDGRLEALSQIVDCIAKETSGDGVILFPGGWFRTDKEKPSTIYDWTEKSLKNVFETIKEHIVVCIGIDGSVDEEDYAHDQIGIAVSKNGIDAIGRKFHPAPQEKNHVELAKDYLTEEDGKSRIFELNGVKYFMCVCYDTYGVRHKNLINPGVDVVLNLVHCFYPKGEGPSGDSYFTRHGFAGASKQWKCPVLGTAVFFNRDIPENWPTGVYWNQDDESTRDWRYSDNPIKSNDKIKMAVKEGAVLVKIYEL